ncbi:hypothetical protein COR50_04885 [Chitinophaga caeni]|uniref:Uncharacterized protein n=1 Tax=Chitinophaga caeni TaxID=2029983 RepID=A0A291QRK3_9BACT|nr:hypothetical protein [Chitinophaga caeni]ATL46567.1 hypothetical protein COR50_04885 [Chitinophaga caeni]
MKNNNILAKIRIQHTQGAVIASFTDFEIFKEISLKENKEFNNWEIGVNDKIGIEGKEYTVKSIFTIIHNETVKNSGQYGMSAVVVDERNEYNFEIVYYVE